MTTALTIVIIFGILILILMYVPRFLVKRAMRNVVAIFRAAGATTPKKATTPAELGLVPPGFLDRIGRMRDYRPQALRLLAQVNVIRMTEEGKVYLSEEELENSPVKQWAGID